MIKKIKNVINNIFFDRYSQNKPFVDLYSRLNNNQIQQRLFYTQIKQNFKTDKSLPTLFPEMGFRVYSQTDEDGLLLFIFSIIGFSNKICLDIAFGNPMGSNTTNLICNWGFKGYLFEASNVKSVNDFFNNHHDTYIYPPKVIQKWITVKNINRVIADSGLKGEIDLFSLDVDGVDYWLLKELDVVSPRVILLEYQDILGPKRKITVPYSKDFDRFNFHPDYFGASLPAFVSLAKRKNYRLVGVNKYGYNAFFIRNDIVHKEFPEINIESCFNHPKVKDGIKNRYPKIKDLPWQIV